MMEMPSFSLIATIFILTNPIGYAPAILAQVKQFPFEKQKSILLREASFALLIAFFFQFFGEAFLSLLHVHSFAVSICGGIILLLSSLGMMFSEKEDEHYKEEAKEPFIIPIATPFLAGGGLLTVVMLYSQQLAPSVISLAIVLAWIGVFAVMFAAPYGYRFLGRRGFAVIEQIMGMITLMIAVDLLVHGFGHFFQSL